MKHDEDSLLWLGQVLAIRPKDNCYLESERGAQVEKLCIEHDLNNFSWRRSDVDTFWIDVQLFVKYKLTDDDILYILDHQPGVDNYRKYKDERNAYAEMMRGMEKLKAFERRYAQEEKDKE